MKVAIAGGTGKLGRGFAVRFSKVRYVLTAQGIKTKAALWREGFRPLQYETSMEERMKQRPRNVMRPCWLSRVWRAS